MTEMEFCVLGPLVVRTGTVAVRVPRGKQRAVLAALLMAAGRVVSLDELIEALWGPVPPATAREALQNHVMRLRKTLGGEGARVMTQPPGYLIRVDPGELDVTRFQAHLDAARAAVRGNRWEAAASAAKAALALWRGEPLADADCEVLMLREAPRLAELRLEALETRIDADLRLGRHAGVITELRQLTGASPLRERAHARLMLALYRDGRQAEALAAYSRARKVLVQELGVEPGAELRELHQQILSADPALAVTDLAPSPPGAPGRPVPRELPPAVPGFTGRSAELRALTALLDRTAESTPAVVISAIGGTAGVGKTALAVQWAHLVADRFPDGQLYVNLRGYDPGEPMSAEEALAGFLLSLGVPGKDIPPEVDQRAARYRSLLAGRRVLIVADNAGSADQVRPLLPGTPSCAMVVTSRDALAGLVARDGATRLDLDVLPLAEAVALLGALIGARVDAEPGAAADLAGACCRLPLALRVAAELAAALPGVPLAAVAGELAGHGTRLDLLAAGGDARTQVRAVFSWSCRHLDPDAARAFRLLGLHPGPDFEPYAAAALTGTTMPQARRVLDVLARAYLISPAGPGRYGMHDLLRDYARELAAGAETAHDQHAALTRLFDFYLHTAAAAMDTLLPAERHCRPRIPRPATPAPPLADLATARDWLDRDRAALVAVAAHTAAGDWPAHATRLAVTVGRYLRSGGHLPEATTVFSHGLGAARRTGDRVAEAAVLTQIGMVDWQLNRYQQAADHHRQALALFRAAGERAGGAYALGGLGLAETSLGRSERAARHLQEAVAIFRGTGDRFGEAWTLGLLGMAQLGQGRDQEAAGAYQQSLDLSREIGDREGGAWSLARLGVLALRSGRYEHAAGYFEQALAVFQEIGSTVGVSEMAGKLGKVYLCLGRYEQAAASFEQALAMFREIGDRSLQADALIGLGEVLVQTGDAGKARAQHAAALRLACEAGLPLTQARAHCGLASAWQADGDPVQARHHLQEALTRCDALGAPQARGIRARLAMAGDDISGTNLVTRTPRGT